MADRLTADQRRLNMSRVRAKNTRPELAVRRLLHRAGFRFRLHRRDLPGCPDIVLTRYRAAVFVHGCFWHGHSCSLFKIPATRTEFWCAKIEANRLRDAVAKAALRDAGWRNLWIWECALKGRARLPEDALVDRIIRFIKGDALFEEIREGGD